MNTITGEMIHDTLIDINATLPHEESKLCNWCNTNTVMSDQDTCKSLYCIAGYAYITQMHIKQ